MEVRNIFKGLDLVERVPGELLTEVSDIVQETGIQDHPNGKTTALTRQMFVGKVMSLRSYMPSSLVITFLPRSKGLLI